MMINQIIELGEQVQNKWKLVNENKSKFSQIALDALKEFHHNIDLGIFESQISQWLLTTHKLPEQLNVYNNFGQPPITLFNNGEFVIDIYFWTHYNTSIHSHSFAGAFKILYGQSLHEVFNLKKKQIFTHDIELNEIELAQSVIMHQGDTHSIKHGLDFCHRVIHLDQPTLSLCIRTLNDSETPQWHYFENGLSIRKRELDQDIYKKLFYFQYLLEKDMQKSSAFLELFMDNLDDSLIVNLFEQLLTDGMGLSEIASYQIHEFIVEKYQKEDWYRHYEEFYEENQFYIEPKEDTALDRFLAHATNTKYSENLTKDIISKLK